ncbi:MAG: T9SS type A sorting domain-containing protein [Spirochaetales bacterium]|nr:T9SS type A sorting domain-containing protein [Spirochaetales bacterium]
MTLAYSQSGSIIIDIVSPQKNQIVNEPFDLIVKVSSSNSIKHVIASVENITDTLEFEDNPSIYAYIGTINVNELNQTTHTVTITAIDIENNLNIEQIDFIFKLPPKLKLNYLTPDVCHLYSRVMVTAENIGDFEITCWNDNTNKKIYKSGLITHSPGYTYFLIKDEYGQENTIIHNTYSANKQYLNPIDEQLLGNQIIDANADYIFYHHITDEYNKQGIGIIYNRNNHSLDTIPTIVSNDKYSYKKSIVPNGVVFMNDKIVMHWDGDTLCEIFEEHTNTFRGYKIQGIYVTYIVGDRVYLYNTNNHKIKFISNNALWEQISVNDSGDIVFQHKTTNNLYLYIHKQDTIFQITFDGSSQVINTNPKIDENKIAFYKCNGSYTAVALYENDTTILLSNYIQDDTWGTIRKIQFEINCGSVIYEDIGGFWLRNNLGEKKFLTAEPETLKAVLPNETAIFVYGARENNSGFKMINSSGDSKDYPIGEYLSFYWINDEINVSKMGSLYTLAENIHPKPTCSYSNIDNSRYKLFFTGTPPFTFTYYDSAYSEALIETSNYSYDLELEHMNSLTITSLSDKYCDGDEFHLTSIDEKSINYKIYPNPAENYINIESETLISNVIIYDELGRSILEYQDINQKEFTIDVSTFNFGFYLVKILDNKNNYNFSKVIVF